jgi:hypothetical protein
MGAEDYEGLKAFRNEKQARGADRRAEAELSFPAARDLARSEGMDLYRHDAGHYALSHPSGWLMNIFPGNRRLYSDRNRPVAPPFIPASEIPDFTLEQVVKAAARAVARMAGRKAERAARKAVRQ